MKIKKRQIEIRKKSYYGLKPLNVGFYLFDTQYKNPTFWLCNKETKKSRKKYTTFFNYGIFSENCLFIFNADVRISKRSDTFQYKNRYYLIAP